ncbi:hypothetical protein PsorP6_003923 [Peronosclerospora sorghi]|uniref:Uncharacterized protein n=1 Tax=Peronosclerospora sorghi TaxID=230839 RepID=A0ACC0VJ87_9STRA|nr:hypothetical protein PsorP6_003923 [Peronosclerospora sorghi]
MQSCPFDALVTRLLPEGATFRGNMQLSKAASGDGCALYLTVKGAVLSVTSDCKDTFDVARNVHEQLTVQLSSNGLENVSLARAVLVVDGKKLLSVSTLMNQDSHEPHESVLTVQSGTCTQLLNTLADGQNIDGMLPRHVETTALRVTKQRGIDETADCIVSLEVNAQTPHLEPDAAHFKLLKSMDETMESFFASQSSATLASANVQLHAAPAEKKEALSLAVETQSVNTTLSKPLTFNLPSYTEALGIFALTAVLVAMMMGVVIMKKRQDCRSRERYERANRASQIRRVSIRMSQHDTNDGQEYEGEEDRLLL